MSKEESEVIGHVGVDAGCIQIGDPCYTHEESGDWSDYCEKVLSQLSGGKNFAQIPYDKGREGKAVVVSSGYGDGFYPVTVTRTKQGAISSVKVTFID